jgi:plasmid stabilization system protein ParE
MRVEYSKRALADLRQIAAYYARYDNPVLGPRVGARIKEVVKRIAEFATERTRSGEEAGCSRRITAQISLQDLLSKHGRYAEAIKMANDTEFGLAAYFYIGGI